MSRLQFRTLVHAGTEAAALPSAGSPAGGWFPPGSLVPASGLGEYFLRPVGLLALVSVLPLLLLYLLRPDPPVVELPTLRFIEEEGSSARNLPGLRSLRRNLLLLVQLLVLLLLSVSLASPYVSTAGPEDAGETVLVVDASASMATAAGGETRFARALAAARADATAETTVVVAGATVRTLTRRAGERAARSALDSLSVSGAGTDLAAAISRAASIAGEGARIRVYSDFAADGRWRRAARVARAGGNEVTFARFGSGGADNVGIVGYDFEDGGIAVQVRNFGGSDAARTVSLGEQSREVSLDAGGVATARLPIPPDGGTVRLRPGDSFGVDDTLPVAAPADPTVEVLLVTNRGDEHLSTALSVVDDVNLTRKRPPASITGRYDVVVFSGVDPDRLLAGTVETARNTVERGGGVVVRAQSDLRRIEYGRLLPLSPGNVSSDPTLRRARGGDLTADITFPAPERYVEGRLERGRALLRTQNGTALLATAGVGEGRVLYYGYPSGEEAFSYNHMYPVFWKRAVFWLTDRPSLDSLNRRTGTDLTFASETTVRAPTGTVRGESVPLRRVGTYRADGRAYAAALVDPAESNVTSPPLASRAGSGDGSGVGGGGGSAGGPEGTRRPLDLTPVVAGVAACLLVLEAFVLARRGDL